MSSNLPEELDFFPLSLVSEPSQPGQAGQPTRSRSHGCICKCTGARRFLELFRRISNTCAAHTAASLPHRRKVRERNENQSLWACTQCKLY